MADLAAFRMNRAIERRMPDSQSFLDLGEGGKFIEQLRTLVADESSGEGDVRREAAASRVPIRSRMPLVVRGATRLLDKLPADVSALLTDQHAAAPPSRKGLRLIADLDRWLTASDNAPEPAALDEVLTTLLVRFVDRQNIVLHEVELGDQFTKDWAALVDIAAAAVLVRDRWRIAQRATRLLLVAGLLADRLRRPDPFESADEIRRLLRHRTPLLPNPPFPKLLAEDRTELVRQATVSDLYVVRSEWRCYEAAEIADITNVLAGEHLESRRLRIDEREIRQTVDEERTTLDEQAEESSERSDVAEETQREMTFAVHADGQVNTSGQYGATRVETSFGASADFSISDASRRASQLAKESVTRALARVENRRRNERVERLLARTEHADVHQLDNPGPEPTRGIYRWVNRIDRYQVIRFPDRLQLEFQLPEPGNSLLRVLGGLPAGTAENPGDFTLKLEDITRASWATEAANRRVVGVQAPPDAETAVSATLFGASNSATGKAEELWSVDPVEAHEDIGIPPGYEAFEVSVSVEAHPMLGKFIREKEESTGVQMLENFHSIDITATIGGISDRSWKPATAANTIQKSKTQRGNAAASWTLPDNKRTLPHPIRGKLPVTVVAAGAESMVAAVSAQCRLTTESFESWRQGVYDLLLAAHLQAAREFREEQARMTLRGGAVIRERSPARHAEMIRDELRRQIVAWLTDESPFQGRPAVRGDGELDEHTDFVKARDTAAEIQFLEQAFEWQNLVYVAYPYYWARTSTWPDRRSLQTEDEVLGRFLRAGSARVVVSARPGFQEAVTHWLTFRQPWMGGPPPQPNDPLYVSVAREIRDQLLPPEDGVPAESWEARLPTGHRWLDKETDLPRNPKGRLGAAPHTPKPMLCDDEPPAPIP